MNESTYPCQRPFATSESSKLVSSFPINWIVILLESEFCKQESDRYRKKANALYPVNSEDILVWSQDSLRATSTIGLILRGRCWQATISFQNLQQLQTL